MRTLNCLLLLLYLDIISWPAEQWDDLNLPVTTGVKADQPNEESESVGIKEAAFPKYKPEGAFCRRSFDGRSGYCIIAYQCLHVIRENRLHGTKIDLCTYRKNIPVICCPLADKHIEEQRMSAIKCQSYHEGLKRLHAEFMHTISSKECVASLPMIVGGETTRIDEFPHMVALGWTQTEDGDTVNWACGGTLISEFYVLTAAHCVTSSEKPPDVVRLGGSYLNQTNPAQQDIKILVIILHPKYRSSAYYHDIAVLKLAKRVTFSAKVRPACLWQTADMQLGNVTALGWGRTKLGGAKSAALLKVNINIIDSKLCKKLYRKERRLQQGIIESQFCAGDLKGGKDTCQGDSGGPLIAQLPELNCVPFILGITSFGKYCAAPNSPGVYTKVHAYLDWIEKIVFKDYA